VLISGGSQLLEYYDAAMAAVNATHLNLFFLFLLEKKARLPAERAGSNPLLVTFQNIKSV